MAKQVSVGLKLKFVKPHGTNDLHYRTWPTTSSSLFISKLNLSEIDSHRVHNATEIPDEVFLYEWPTLAGLHVRRGPMVEKAVQTLHMDRRQRGGSTASQELQWERSVQRNGRENYQARMSTGATSKHRSNICLSY